MSHLAGMVEQEHIFEDHYFKPHFRLRDCAAGKKASVQPDRLPDTLIFLFHVLPSKGQHAAKADTYLDIIITGFNTWAALPPSCICLYFRSRNTFCFCPRELAISIFGRSLGCENTNRAVTVSCISRVRRRGNCGLSIVRGKDKRANGVLPDFRPQHHIANRDDESI